MKHNRAHFDADDLQIVRRLDPHDSVGSSRLSIGDRVRLNSGGPLSLIVDIDGDTVTVSWTDCGRVWESRAPASCYQKTL
jgi:hypothetical protein